MTTPIIDTGEYIVEFAYGYEAELVANVISSNMYAQFDPNENHYVWLHYIIDFHRLTTDLFHADQKMTQNGISHYQRSTAFW